MAKEKEGEFTVRVFEDRFIVLGVSVKVPIVVEEDDRLVLILRGLAGFKKKKKVSQ